MGMFKRVNSSGSRGTKLQRAGNIGTRVFTGTTSDLSTFTAGGTYEVLMGLAQDFDAVRLILMQGYSASAQATPSVICSAAVVGDTTDATLNAATWTQALWAGNGNVNLAPATTTNRHKYVFSDWISVQSLPRTDGGTLPLLAVRAYLGSSTGVLTLMGNSALSYSNWATHPSGRIWRQKVTAANAATNYATANQAQFTGSRFGSGGTINNGGTGYAVNDTITFGTQGGTTAYTAAVYTVSAVTGGVVTGITVTSAGIYSAAPSTLPQTSTSGTGTGFVINPAWTAMSALTQQSPIVGVQYMARGKVVTIMFAGDSITEGQGTYLAEGFAVPTCVSLSNKNGIAVECANLGWAGQTTAVFTTVASDFLTAANAAGGAPDILVMPNYSPNDVVGASLTAASVGNARTRVQLVFAQARAYGTVPVLWTGLPTDASVRAYGASDSFRQAGNTDTASRAQNGMAVFDASGAVYGGTDGNGQQFMATPANTNDKIHPNDGGNVAIAAVAVPTLRSVIGAP